MALQLSRIDRVERQYDVTAVLPDGSPVVVTALDFALTPPRSGVTGATVWTTFPVTGGIVTVAYAAPDATDQTNALAVPLGGADAHAREVDGSLVKAVKIERITVA